MEMVATVLNNKLYARVTSLYSLPNESNGYTAAAAPAYLILLYYLFSFRQSRSLPAAHRLGLRSRFLSHFTIHYAVKT